MKTLDQKEKIKRITDNLFDLNSWIEASFPSDKRKDFFEKIHLKEDIFWKQYESMTMEISTMLKTIKILNIPPQLIEPLFFKKEPMKELKELLKDLVESSINSERKE